jgi:hypothetical protein
VPFGFGDEDAIQFVTSGEMNMSDKKNRWTKNVPQSNVSRNVIEPEPDYPVWDGFRDVPPRAVALERLWYSLKVLVFGKAVTDAKTSCKDIRRD